MGVDYAASIVVGLQRKDLKDPDGMQELIDEDSIEVVAPYYDGNDSDYAVVGFSYKTSPDYSPTEIVWDESHIDRLKNEFKKLTGQDAKVYLSPRGW